MDTERIPSILLIAGFVVMLLSFLIGPGGIYQTNDIAERKRIIEENQSRWYTSGIVSGLGILLITAGFVAFSIKLRNTGSPWIPTMGAVALIIGALSGGYFLYRYTTDPLGAFSGKYPVFEPLYNFLTLVGLLLIGIAILQTNIPAWLGYLTGGVSFLYGIVFMVTGSGFLTPGLATLLGLVIGIFSIW